MWIASYFASYSPADFVDIAHANEQIIKRIYGEHSERYLQAADYYLHALTFTYDSTAVAQRIERAQALCEDILKQQELRQDSIKLYSCAEIESQRIKSRQRRAAVLYEALS